MGMHRWSPHLWDGQRLGLSGLEDSVRAIKAGRPGAALLDHLGGEQGSGQDADGAGADEERGEMHGGDGRCCSVQ